MFGDMANGRIFYVDMADLLAADDGNPSTTAQVYELNLVYGGQPMTLLEILGASRADLRFGMDLAGNFYITTKTDGFIRRLVPRPSSVNMDPTSITLPVISGTAQVGGTFLTTDGTWNDSDGDSLTYNYQWQADGIEILGAISNSYTLTTNEAHKYMTVVVTASDSNGGNTPAISLGLNVNNGVPTNITLPAISGSTKVGDRLTTSDGRWVDIDDDTLVFSYQWLADGTEIPGAVSNSYTLTRDEVGAAISILLTVDDGNGGVANAESIATVDIGNDTSEGSSNGGSISIVFMLLLIIVRTVPYLIRRSDSKSTYR